MQSTSEQLEIINTNTDINVNATAGSGKTTTLIEYAKTKDPSKRILYLVFNRSVKMEAIEKFKAKGLSNVTVETAHSLAFKHVVIKNGYRVMQNDLTLYQLIQTLQIHNETNTNLMDTQNYMLAYHLKSMLSYYCNSSVIKFAQLKYEETLDHSGEAYFVKNRTLLNDLFKRYWLLMDEGKIEITHDFYLKKFQLTRPKLNYDYILFDEGQDASGVMLDIFSKQEHAIKLIVGDSNQQIYGWRYAVNALDKFNVPSFPLSINFRCNSNITDLASSVLQIKQRVNALYKPMPIIGKGKSTETNVHAVIGRSNVGLLSRAIQYISTNRFERVYFEGKFSSYTYSTEGGSLYDILNLYNDKRDMIKDKLIQSFKTFEEAKDYVEEVNDANLSMFITIVETYGNEIPKHIKQIKNRIVETKEEADVIFTTAARSKGIEYDTVEIVSDYLSESALDKIFENEEKYDYNAICEEINMLYVAITRAKYRVFIPEKLLPHSSKDINNENIIVVYPNNADYENECYPWTDHEEYLVQSTPNLPYLKKVLKRSSKTIIIKQKELGVYKKHKILK